MPSPVTPNPNDGSVVIGAPNQFGFLGQAQQRIDTNLSEYQLVTRYRDMALTALIDWAIDEITNEAIVQDGEVEAVSLDLSNCSNLPPDLCDLIVSEFKNILLLLNWQNEAYQIFRNWYIDGRLYYQILIDEKAPQAGIKELRFIDPRQIRKFIEVADKTDEITKISFKEIADEYYVYAPFGIDYQGSSVIPSGKQQPINGTRLTKDSVVFVHSGIFDSTSSVILSPLHKAIRPLSQLKSMENATLIYKISRAPERRVWKIPVGNIAEKQVPNYLQQVVSQYRTRMAYDAFTGDVLDERKVLSIIDDIFIPVPSSGESVSIDTLQSGQSFDETNTIDYFNKQLLRALSVPSGRLQNDASALFGNTGTITRDELKFAKLIFRLRKQFSHLFEDLLHTQLRLKGVIQSQTDWEYLISHWQFKFATDNYYSEMTETSLWQQRLTMAGEASQFVGKYLSNRWIRKHILKLTDDDQKQLQKEIAEEVQSGEIPITPEDNVTEDMLQTLKNTLLPVLESAGDVVSLSELHKQVPHISREQLESVLVSLDRERRFDLLRLRK